MSVDGFRGWLVGWLLVARVNGGQTDSVEVGLRQG